MNDSTHLATIKQCNAMLITLSPERTVRALSLITNIYDEELKERQISADARAVLLAQRSEIERHTIVQATEFSADACIALGVSVKDMQAKNRANGIPLVRHAIFYTLRRNWVYLVLKKIGEILRPHCPIDHSTVIHGINKFTDLLSIKDARALKINLILSNLISAKYASPRQTTAD
jgi:chromosomal replication initiation ATPase DnaA